MTEQRNVAKLANMDCDRRPRSVTCVSVRTISAVTYGGGVGGESVRVRILSAAAWTCTIWKAAWGRRVSEARRVVATTQAVIIVARTAARVGELVASALRQMCCRDLNVDVADTRIGCIRYWCFNRLVAQSVASICSSKPNKKQGGPGCRRSTRDSEPRSVRRHFGVILLIVPALESAQ